MLNQHTKIATDELLTLDFHYTDQGMKDQAITFLTNLLGKTIHISDTNNVLTIDFLLGALEDQNDPNINNLSSFLSRVTNIPLLNILTRMQTFAQNTLDDSYKIEEKQRLLQQINQTIAAIKSTNPTSLEQRYNAIHFVLEKIVQLTSISPSEATSNSIQSAASASNSNTQAQSTPYVATPATASSAARANTASASKKEADNATVTTASASAATSNTFAHDASFPSPTELQAWETKKISFDQKINAKLLSIEGEPGHLTMIITALTTSQLTWIESFLKDIIDGRIVSTSVTDHTFNISFDLHKILSDSTGKKVKDLTYILALLCLDTDSTIKILHNLLDISSEISEAYEPESDEIENAANSIQQLLKDTIAKQTLSDAVKLKTIYAALSHLVTIFEYLKKHPITNTAASDEPEADTNLITSTIQYSRSEASLRAEAARQKAYREQQQRTQEQFDRENALAQQQAKADEEARKRANAAARYYDNANRDYA